MPICILMEKPSAFKHMTQALHGKALSSSFAKASFNGKEYYITHSVGHIRTYVDPTKMLKDKSKVKQYSTWSINAPIWNPNDFNWKKHTIKGDSDVLRNISYVANQCDSIIIGTDDDPSGEGDDLGYEIIQAMHWTKPVYRIRFADEQPKSLQHALIHATPMKDPSNWNIYKKAVGRSRWDFLSMELTRYATAYAKHQGYAVRVVNEGRLKSVILLQIYKRWQAIKNYVKKPYYEVRFKDANGHIFSRKASYKSHPKYRFPSLADGKNDMAKYHASKPANIKTQTKTKAPGQLLNLASLGARLGQRGYSPKEVQDTYQKLYEDEIVSYPRTDDKKMTLGQFKQIEPLADKIAKVVGVDPKLLTHRQPRKKFLTKHADHGANRPGPHVPSSLSALKSYGDSAPAIYSVLSKNFLATLCEDYVYKRTTAQLADYPDFKTSYSTPVKMNYKQVFNDGNDKDNATKPLASVDNPFLYSGTNPKPSKPTLKWIYGFLGKKNIGTGATRQGTLAQISSGKDAKVKINRARLKLTNSGIICAQMAQNTLIGNPIATKQLYQIMDSVQKGTQTISNVEKTALIVIKHDKPIFAKNVNHISAPKRANARETFSVDVNGQTKNVNRKFMNHRFSDDEVQKLKAGQSITLTDLKSGKMHVTGNLGTNTFKLKNGKTISYYGFHPTKFTFPDQKEKVHFNGKTFNRTFGNHRFTDDEIKELEAGKTITINCKKRSGSPYQAQGKLADQVFKSRGKSIKFYGFKLTKYIPNDKDKAKYAKRKARFAKYKKIKAQRPKATIKDGNGKLRTGHFKATWSGHEFTDDEIKQLQAGNLIQFKAKSHKGTPYTAKGRLQWQKYGRYTFLGFKAIWK